MQAASCKLQAAHGSCYQLHADASCKLQLQAAVATAKCSRYLQAASGKLQLQAASCKLQAASCKLRAAAASCKLQLQAASCMLQAAAASEASSPADRCDLKAICTGRLRPLTLRYP